MPDFGNISVFNPVDASNTSGTYPTWPEGMPPSDVNNSARALQGALARDWEYRSFAITTTMPVSNGYVAAFSVAPSSLPPGMAYGLKINATNTGPATLNVGIGGAKPIKVFDRLSGVLRDVAAGEMKAGSYLLFVYEPSGDVFAVNVVTRDFTFDPPAIQVRACVRFSATVTQTEAGTYTRSGNSIICVMTAHGYIAGNHLDIAFSGIPHQTDIVISSVTDANTFVLTYTSGSGSGTFTIEKCQLLHGVNVRSVFSPGGVAGLFVVNLASAAPHTNQYMTGCMLDPSINTTIGVANYFAEPSVAASYVQFATSAAGGANFSQSYVQLSW
jgi:hypothetical protein